MSVADTILWLGDVNKASALRDLLAANYRVVAITAAELSAGSLGVDRFGLLAEGDHAAAALSLARSHPEAVAALALLGPTALPDGDIKVPVLAAFGTKDKIAPPEMGRRFRALVPNCNVVFVYDAGATMAAERPEAVAELLGEFFARGDAFLVRQNSDRLFP
jgi:pimeloyl-ACP methyl ester carboxylesterase